MANITPTSLLEKTNDFTVCNQRYQLLKSHGKIICFVEGKYDSDYYLDKFRNHFGDNFEFLVCKNKKNVLRAFERFYSVDHAKVKMGFFVDHDFDIVPNNNLVFVTDRYSIENYYCSVKAMERLLRYGLKIQDENERNSVLSCYVDTAEKFHDVVAEFNSFYSLAKRKQRQSGTVYKICLEKTFPSKMATIEIGNFQKKYNLGTLLSEYSLPNNLMTQDEIDKELILLNSRNPFCSYRGKYELEFTIKFLTMIVNKANTRDSTSVVKQKISATINNVCFMSDYAQYADVADGLLEYLQKVKTGL